MLSTRYVSSSDALWRRNNLAATAASKSSTHSLGGPAYRQSERVARFTLRTKVSPFRVDHGFRGALLPMAGTRVHPGHVFALRDDRPYTT